MDKPTDKPMIVDAWLGRPTRHIPLWLMRQAGRYLPEYRQVRAQAGSFLDLCYNPDLAMEVTLQPMRRFDLDAAIIFSDILVVPHALGQHVYFVEGEGPRLDPIDFNQLSFNPDHLNPVYEAIRKTRAALAKDKALIGFAGAPLTLACYMIEGRGSSHFPKMRAMMQEDPAGFAALIDLLTDAVIAHLQRQIASGCDAVQVFESHAGQLAGADFAAFVVRPMRKIVAALNKKVPVIGFARGAAQDDLLRYATDTGIDVAGIDQHTDMGWAAANIPPRVVLQGNLAPELLLAGGVSMQRAAQRIRTLMAKRPFVFNLGHGVIKETNPDHVAQLVETVHGYQP